MKKNILILVSFLMGLGLMAQTEAKFDKKAPEITFEKTVHNYGTIKKGSDGTCEFTFKNTGKKPLILQNVKTSCGCTTPSWPKEPLAKGKKATIKVKYDTKRVGKFAKTITVYSNAKNSPIVLRIEGKVEVDDKTNQNFKLEDAKKKSEKQ